MIISLNQNSDISVALAFLTGHKIRSKYLQLKISLFLIVLFSKNHIRNGSFAREPIRNRYRAIVSRNIQTCWAWIYFLMAEKMFMIRVKFWRTPNVRRLALLETYSYLRTKCYVLLCNLIHNFFFWIRRKPEIFTVTKLWNEVRICHQFVRLSTFVSSRKTRSVLINYLFYCSARVFFFLFFRNW